MWCSIIRRKSWIRRDFHLCIHQYSPTSRCPVRDRIVSPPLPPPSHSTRFAPHRPCPVLFFVLALVSLTGEQQCFLFCTMKHMREASPPSLSFSLLLSHTLPLRPLSVSLSLPPSLSLSLFSVYRALSLSPLHTSKRTHYHSTLTLHKNLPFVLFVFSGNT